MEVYFNYLQDTYESAVLTIHLALLTRVRGILTSDAPWCMQDIIECMGSRTRSQSHSISSQYVVGSTPTVSSTTGFLCRHVESRGRKSRMPSRLYHCLFTTSPRAKKKTSSRVLVRSSNSSYIKCSMMVYLREFQPLAHPQVTSPGRR